MSTLGSVILEGLLSALPSASIPGRLYFATDTGQTLRDNGTTWDTVSTTGFSNPMTTQGDIIYGGTSGSPTRLAAGASGRVLTANGAGVAPSWQPPTGGVTSVAVTVPSHQTVSGSPVTSSGTIAITDNTQAANTVFRGPTTGSPAAPTFGALVPADLPVATTGAFGAVKPDGTTITVSGGVISSTGGSSPLTTKGDLAGFSTVPTRVPVGANATLPIADSTQTTGIRYDLVGSANVATPLDLVATSSSSKVLTLKPNTSIAPIAFVQGAASSLGTVGSSTVTLPLNVTAGNCILLAASVNAALSANTITDTLGNTYTFVPGSTSFTSFTQMRVFVCPNAIGGACTITYACTPNATIGLMAHEYSGVDLSSPVDVANNNSSSSAVSSLSVSLTTAGSSEMVVTFGAADGTVAMTTPAPSTQREQNTGGVRNIVSGDYIAAAVGAHTQSVATATGTNTNVLISSVALKPNLSVTVPADLLEFKDTIGNVVSSVNGVGQVVLPAQAGNPTNAPTHGALSYDTTAAQPIYYNGTSWVSFTGTTSVPVTTIAASGASQTIAYAASGDIAYDITLSANCTISLTTPSTGTTLRHIILWIHPAGFTATLPASSGTLAWNGGSPPVLSTSVVSRVAFENDGTTLTLGGY